METYYPRSIIKIVDDSQIPAVNINAQTSPVVLAAFASPKGPEEMRLISGKQFYTDYINSIGVNFDKYGQALLQVENVINTGGVVLAKRVVADDANLANLSVVAKVTTKQVQKVDANGKPVFKDPVTQEEIVAPGVLAAKVPDALTTPTNHAKIAQQSGTTIIKKNVGTGNVAPVAQPAHSSVSINDSDSKVTGSSPVVIKPGNGITTKAGETSTPDKVVSPTSPSAVKPDVTKPTTTTNTPDSKPATPVASKPTADTGKESSDKATTAKPASDTTPSSVPASKVTPVVKSPEPVMQTVVVVTYECNTTSGAFTMSDIKTGIAGLLDNNGDDNVFTYPLFTISDVGRGVSEKKIRIVPNYQEAKSIETMVYNLVVMENGNELENIPFTINPNLILNGVNTSIETAVNNNSTQVKCVEYANSISLFIAKIAELGNVSTSFTSALDLFFGKDIQSPTTDLTGYSVNLTDGINLQYAFGIDLDSGSNGAFGDFPIQTEAYNQQIIKFFSGEYTSEIYDLDNYKIDLCLDACYPKQAKRAIEDLAIFRQDFQFLEDVGTTCYTLAQILAVAGEATQDRATTVYGQSFDVLDPHSRKQITVSMTYAISKLIVNHFMNGRTRPLAGEIYNVTVPEIIPGTLNYLPKVTPNVDEKAILANARVNYGSYYNQLFVIETLYTNQTRNTQLSYTNNMFAVQEIVKVIRTECPKTRYSFITGKDFTTYQNEVNRVLSPFKGSFAALEMVYLEQPTMLQNKVFSAAIKVQFKDFVQTELFTIYALNNSGVTTASTSVN